MANSGIKATANAFITKCSFPGLISSSSAPSRTMSIKPTVPITGSKGFRFGGIIFVKLLKYWTATPKASNRITDGILVLDDDMSKTYAIKNKIQIVMIEKLAIQLKSKF